ncbi:hypothetical protein GCM10010269_47180 [Streptomyces humidus]|uniref:Uncharacterized protein n=1 Tax=Streptomyces humidus TaxID=52259 RepID=A0A918FYB3_9ACTN|nr:hypothetical protein [Streptomyces humidus]GGS02847.1 hypothetical protein GCM10010269_47180 [Streptomyces humidus]
MSPAFLLCGLGAAGLALARLAIGGFAPDGHLPAVVLAVHACGLVALCSVRPPSQDTAVGSRSAPE